MKRIILLALVGIAVASRAATADEIRRANLRAELIGTWAEKLEQCASKDKSNVVVEPVKYGEGSGSCAVRWLFLCLAFALAAGLVWSTSQASAEPCAVGVNTHNHARIMLNHKRLAQCNGAAGCKCVSCYNLDRSVTSTCYPLA